MLRKDAKIDLLRRVPLFADCSKKELGQISQIADEIDLPAGKSLIAEGDRGRQFYVIIDGEVSVKRNGRPVPLRGGTEFFGEIALLTDSPTVATVATTSPVRALVITDRSFKRLLKDTPALQLKVLKALAERVAAVAP